MKKVKANVGDIVNRRARFDYALQDEFVVGIILSGAEVRALRDGHAHLKGAFATFKGDELWLNNASISVRISEPGTSQTVVTTEPHKLLAHKKELDAMLEAKREGLTIVPLKIMTRGRFIKLIIATGKGKKQYDKRETIKRREQTREARRQIKNTRL